MDWFPLLPFTHFMAFLIYAYILAITLSKSTKRPINLAAASLLLCLAIWSLGKVFLHHAGTPHSVAVIFDRLTAWWVFFPACSLLFLLVFSENIKILHHKLFRFFFVAMPIMLFYQFLSGRLMSDPYKVPYGWYSNFSNTIWAYVFFLYYAASLLGGMYLTLQYALQLTNAVKKTQAFIILLTAFVSFLIGTLAVIVIPLISANYASAAFTDIADVIAVLWALGVYYIILKFKFMVLTPATAAENIILNMTESLILLDDELHIKLVNKSSLNLLGYAEKELIGKPFAALFADKYKASALLKKILKESVVSGWDTVFIKKNSANVPVNFSATLVSDDEGVKGIVCVATDMTERKRAEEEMRKERDKAQMYLDIAEIIFVVVDLDKKVLLINNKGCELLEDTRENILGKNWFENYVPAEDRSVSVSFHDGIIAGLSSPGGYVDRLLTKSGKTRFIKWSHTALRDPAGRITGVLSAGDDVTVQRQMEQELQDSENRLKILFEYAPDAYYLYDLQGRLIDGNKAAENLTGSSRAELIGKNFKDFLYEDQTAKADALFANNALGTPSGPDEMHFKKKDDPFFTLEISSFPVKIKGETVILGIARDITARKKEEQQLKESYAKLQEADQLKSNFISMVSHELRTPLTSIKGFMALLAGGRIGKFTPEQQGYLEIIENNSERLLKLINDLLDLSKMESGTFVIEKAYCDIIQTVNTSIQEMRFLADKKNIEITSEAAATPLSASVDEFRISQALENLINNAIKFSSNNSKIKISIDKTCLESVHLPDYLDPNGLRGKECILIGIKDEGLGIPSDKLQKIFDRFYQIEDIYTRQAQGTGLGLYIVKNIVELHGGVIWADSRGKGAVFHMLLPEQ